MVKIITAKTMGGEWYFASPSNNPYTVPRSSDGVDRDPGSNSGNPRPIDQDKYYAHTTSHWSCSGIPWSGTGMWCGTKTNIGDHYWSSYIFGVDAETKHADCRDVECSPVHNNLIYRMSFDWEKIDGATKSSTRHHIRMASVGLICRTGNNSCTTKGWPCPTNERLHKFETSTTSPHKVTGSYNKTCSGAYAKYPIGFWVCIEWQGNGLNSAESGVPGIRVKNLRLGVNTTNDPILLKFQKYSSFSPADKLPIWTK